MAALVDVEITAFYLLDLDQEKSHALASFNVDVGDFRVRRCMIKRYKETGNVFVQLTERNGSSVTIASPSETRAAIEVAALARYRLETGKEL